MIFFRALRFGGRVCRFLSISTGAIAAALLVPIMWSLAEGDAGLRPLAISFGVGVAVSAAFALLGAGSENSPDDMGPRESILSVALSWVVVSSIVGMPYFFAGAATPLDALFEGVSGFTTTGASVLTGLSRIPRSILFWRSFSQWIGGIGIIVLTLAMLPLSGAGMQLYRAEISGPTHQKLTPRIQHTAIFLCKTYLVLTVLQMTLLMFGGGLGFFDAATLSFSTLATGGFSPYEDNVGHFSGVYVKFVTAIFLFLAGASLTFYHTLIVRRDMSALQRNPELKFYIFMLLLFGTSTSLILYRGGVFPTLGLSLMEGFFHSAGMLSTCGFFISDYGLWPSAARQLMLVLMFCGGCAVSAAGGITCIRVLVIARHVRDEFVRILHPRAVIPDRFAGEAPDGAGENIVASCFAFLTVYIATYLVGFVLLTLFGQDMTTAVSGAAATLGNVGPGFGMVGPAESYAAQPAPIKLVYMFLMLCGRVELFTVLIVFSRGFWRR